MTFILFHILVDHRAKWLTSVKRQPRVISRELECSSIRSVCWGLCKVIPEVYMRSQRDKRDELDETTSNQNLPQGEVDFCVEFPYSNGNISVITT